MGKTAIGNKIAKETHLQPIVFSLMDHEPSDICGLPDLNGPKATFKEFDTFPVEGDTIPEGKNGWLIMLDEFASGNRAMQAAANKLLYERMVGNKHLHPKAFVMAMGNLASDNAYVNEAPTHTKSRQAHIYVEQDVKEWVDWAMGAGIDMYTIAYTRSKPSMLTKFDPNSVDINYPCARTLEMLSDITKGFKGKIGREYLPLIQGILGVGTGLEYFNWLKLADNLPTIEDILADPTGVAIPEKPSYRYMLAANIADNFNEKDADQMMQFITRLGMDYQYFIFSAATKRKPALLHRVEAVGEWAEKIADKYF